MSFYYHNPTCHVGFVLIAKNASSSIEPYLNETSFSKVLIDDLNEVDKSSRWFYILRNPIERFCSGLVETYLAVTYHGFGTSTTHNAVMAMSDFSAQEFCFNLLARIPVHNSKDRLPENNIPVNEGMGYTEDMHTMLQSQYIKDAVAMGLDLTPISLYRSSDLPQILKIELPIAENYSDRLLKHNVKHINQSTDHKKRMNDNLKAILVANKEVAVFRHIWDYLAPDIELWNQNINRRYMQQYHMSEEL